MARLADLQRSTEVRAAAPVIAATLLTRSNVRVRNVATVGGNVAHAALSIAASIRVEEQIVRDVRIAVGAATETARRFRVTEALLAGGVLDDALTSEDGRAPAAKRLLSQTSTARLRTNVSWLRFMRRAIAYSRASPARLFRVEPLDAG